MKEQNDSSQVTPNAKNGIKKERQEKELEMRRRLEAERNQGERRLAGIPVEITDEPLRGKIASPHRRKEGICDRLLSKLSDKIFADDNMGYPKISWNNFYDGCLKGRAPFVGIDRHRLGTDGKGVTTLVVFHGCPLRCKYCLNKQALEKDGIREKMTPQELYEEVKKDNLYFQATGGGITLGGGEPCLYSKFIVKFREVCNPAWKFTLETSLNVSVQHLRRLLPVIDYYIIDIKDMDAARYRSYTGSDNSQVISNLKFLLAQGKAKQMLVRVPLIPRYNTEEDVNESVAQLRAMGVVNIERFTYSV